MSPDTFNITYFIETAVLVAIRPCGANAVAVATRANKANNWNIVIDGIIRDLMNLLSQILAKKVFLKHKIQLKNACGNSQITQVIKMFQVFALLALVATATAFAPAGRMVSRTAVSMQ